MKNRSCCLLAVLLFGTMLPAQETAPGNRQPSLRIRARVLDADGQPLAGAGLVSGSAEAVTTSAALTHPDARCTKEGTLVHELPLPADELSPTVLLIAAPGKVAFRLPNLSQRLRGRGTNPEELDLGEIRLPNGHSQSGRVRNAGGMPIAGARICAVDCLATYPWLTPAYGSQAITDERGVFVLPGVFADAMVVDVQAAGYYDRHFPWAHLGTPLDVRLEASGFVEGTVLAADGEPLACSVAISSEYLGVQQHFMPTQLGRFRLPVGKPGRFKVTAYLDGWQAVADSSLLHGPATGIELRCDADDAQSFVVRAVDAATEAPVAAIRASVFWADADLDASLESTLQRLTWPSGRDGKVRLPPASAASEKGIVCVLAAGHAPFYQPKVAHQPGKPFVARLVRESRVEGRIVDAATGRPMAGVQVTCEREERRKGAPGTASAAPPSTRTAADGSFVIGGLAAGDYVVVARRPTGTARVKKKVVLPAEIVERDLTLELPVGVAVTGKVSGLDAARGWQLQLSVANNDRDASPFETGADLLEAWNQAGAVAIGDGTYRFEHRAPGTEQLFLVVPQPPRHGAALRIPVGKVTIDSTDVAFDLDLTAHRPGSIAGKLAVTGVEIPFGRLAVVATRLVGGDPTMVTHAEQLRRRHWALAADDGSYTIPVAPGSYSIEVVDVATGVVLLPTDETIEVVAGKRVTRDLAIPLATLRIRFEHEPAGPLPAQRLSVSIGKELHYSDHVTLFGGGTWGSPGVDLIGVDRDAPLFVPPGTVRLQVQGGVTRINRGSVTFGGDVPQQQAFEAAAGKEETVTLKLPAPKPLEEK
jgi:hypothetical protein